MYMGSAPLGIGRRSVKLPYVLEIITLRLSNFALQQGQVRNMRIGNVMFRYPISLQEIGLSAQSKLLITLSFHFAVGYNV